MANSIGQPISRVDGKLKVQGRATYAYEHKIPHVAYGVLITSTIAKGRIMSMDTHAAERHPGVIAIMTPKNTAKLPQPKSSTAKAPTTRVVQLLQDNLVRYAEQPIGIAIAETLESATEAAQLVQVKYVVAKPEVKLATRIANAYQPEKAGGGGDPAKSNRGDFKTALANAPVKVDQVYTTPFQTHNPMEPHATIAVWDGPDKLTLYDATQGIFGDKQRVATLLGLHPDDVHVISPYLGGGFGSKGPSWSHVTLTAMAARHVKRPVKIALRRNQMFGPIGHRSETRQAVTAAATHDGTLVALRHDVVCHTSTFDEFVESAGLPARMLYNCPNNATSHRLVKSDIGTPSFMRAPGEAPGTNTLEIAIDEIAYALKIDPLEFRLKNYAEQDPEKNRPWSSKSLRECYRVGAERFGWSKRTHEPRSMRDKHSLIGWGVASSVYPTRRSEATAVARLHKDGSLLVEAGTQDLGTGTYTIMTQIAADAIGAPFDRVTFRLGDTAYPETPVSGGSQTAASTGSAVHLAGKALREKLIQAAVTSPASPLTGASAQDVEIADGKLFVRSAPSRSMTFAELMRLQREEMLEGHGDAQPGEERDKYSMYAFGAQFAEVRIDEDLGQIRVSRMTGVFGAGKILNPKTARSQFIGGMVWGISFALHEHTMMDERLGRFVNNNLAEYHVPVNADVPAIDALWVDEVDEHVNPIGVKGIGEIGITGAAAAVANAVYHATGKRIRDYPITLDKLL